MLSACGISEFWAGRLAGSSPLSTGHSLAGKLKTAPEDFVVAEVDLHGQRTDTAAGGAAGPFVFYCDPLKTTPEPSTEEQEGCPDGEEMVEAGSGVEATDGLAAAHDGGSSPEDNGAASQAFADKLTAALETLDACLTKEQLASDEEVAARTQTLTAHQLALLVDDLGVGAIPVTRADGTAPLDAAECWWRQEFPLATALGKEQRRLTHFAVRGRYAHMRSRGRVAGGPPTKTAGDQTHGGAGGKDCEDLCAALDVHFVFFAYLFGAGVARAVVQHLQSRAVASAAAKMSADERALLDGLSRAAAMPERTTAPTVLHTAFPSPLVLAPSDSASEGSRPAPSEREVRRAFHGVLRRFYPSVRCSVADGMVTLRLPAASATVGDKRPRERAVRQGLGGAGAPTGFVHCVVRKRNLDTAEMISLLADHYGVRGSSVCVAGMKDKRAITYQRVSFPAPGPRARSSSPAEVLRLPWPSDPLESFLEVVCTSPDTLPSPVHLGQLKGNRFTIRLRGVHEVRASEAETAGHEPLGDSLGPADGTPRPRETHDGAVAHLRRQLSRVATEGFVNYFGQQRFSESVTELRDHTGLHLFTGRWARAVRSTFRACPAEVYDGFPERMDGRFVPGALRDCQCLARALRQSHRLYFSEHVLTREDVQQETERWQRVCEVALCRCVPYALRSIWVHAGQSLFFNVAASFVVHSLAESVASGQMDAQSAQRLASELLLPLAGYRAQDTEGAEAGAASAETVLRATATAHALQTLGLTREVAFGQQRVAGVPVPGSWRRLLVTPSDTNLSTCEASAADPELSVELAFFLPSSSYATVCLREVLGYDEWWKSSPST